MDAKKTENLQFAFFGTSEFSVIVLDELKARGYTPKLVVTVEDKPKGRKLVVTAPEVKIWAEKEGIKCIQLKTLRKPESEEMIRSFLPPASAGGAQAGAPSGFDYFVVASYGKIIPQNILDIPRLGTLNVHPSLLPKLRGPSPIESAILFENETGMTIMRLDADMDHGPIVAQKKVEVEWPPYADELERKLAHIGGEMVAELLPDWVEGKIKETEQDHSLATICKKIEKNDGELNLEDLPEKNLRKIRAYHIWPGAYFFENKGNKKTRIIVKKAHMEDNKLVLDRVVPEGKKEMDYKDYLRGKK